MAYPQIAGGAGRIQIWKAAANTSNKIRGQLKKSFSSAGRQGEGLKTLCRKKEVCHATLRRA
jgi:hypothetical protein